MYKLKKEKCSKKWKINGYYLINLTSIYQAFFLYNLRFLEALRMFVQWRPNHRFPTQALNLEAELDFRHPRIIQFSMFYLFHMCTHTRGKRDRRRRESGEGEGEGGKRERGEKKGSVNMYEKTPLKRPIN